MRISDWSSDVCSSDLVLARELLPVHGVAGADHVLIGRSEGIERDFGLLRGELEKALKKVMSRPLGEAPPRRRDSSKEKKKASTRSEESRVGKEGVSTSRLRWTRYN